MRITVLLSLIILILASLVPAPASLAAADDIAHEFADVPQEQRRPSRRDSRGPKVDLTRDEVSRLNRAWDQKRNPRVLVSVGVIRGGTVRYDENNEIVSRMRSVIVGQLAPAFRNSMIDLDVQTIRAHALAESMQHNANDAMGLDVENQLRDTFNANVRVDILLRDDGGKLHPESFVARDLDQGSLIHSGVLNPNADLLAEVGLDRVYGVYVCSELVTPFEVWAGDHFTTYTIRALSQFSGGDGVQKSVRRLPGKISEVLGKEGVDWADSAKEEQRGVTATRLSVRFRGELADLLLAIEDEVLEDLGLGWDVIKSEGSAAGVYIYKRERPVWHILTDEEEGVAHHHNLKRVNRLAGSQIAVVVGGDINDPAGYFDQNTTPQSLEWNEASLRSDLVNELIDLGLKVVNDSSMRERVRALRANSERANNAPDLLKAIGELSEADYILHVNTYPDKKLIARLYDVDAGVERATQVWPTAIASRFAEYSVNANRPEEVARFLAGRIVERWDRALDRGGVTTVRVVNHDGADAVLGICEVLRSGVPGVDEIVDLQISGSAASFEIVYDGDSNSVMYASIDRIATARPGVQVQALRGAIVVDMAPALTAPTPDPLVEDAEGGERESSGNEPQISSYSRLRQAMISAESSVWLVYVVDDKGVKYPVGTAWTVANNLLATNAHVVRMIPDGLEVWAANNSAIERKIRLGRKWPHPRWSEKSTEEFYLDVGLIEVIEGSPGEPLAVATHYELSQLAAPLSVGSIGFPSDGALKKEIPVKQRVMGHINAIVSNELVFDPDADHRMVMHDLQTSGGSSGSPIFDDTGKVIALHNAANEFKQAVPLIKLDISIPTGFKGGVLVSTLTEFMESIQDELPN